MCVRLEQLPLVANDGESPPVSSVQVVPLLISAPLPGDSWSVHLLLPTWLLRVGAATVQAAYLEWVLGEYDQGASTRTCHLFQFVGYLQEGVHHGPEARPSDEVALGGCLVACASDHQACRGCQLLLVGGAHTNDNARA